MESRIAMQPEMVLGLVFADESLKFCNQRVWETWLSDVGCMG